MNEQRMYPDDRSPSGWSTVDATPPNEPGSWVEGIRTRACEQGIHDRCDGTATLSGGRGQYACACGCHPRSVNATPPQDALAALVEAIRLTVEYVGLSTLPPIPGWSWYDALCEYAPELAAHFVLEAVRLEAAS